MQQTIAQQILDARMQRWTLLRQNLAHYERAYAAAQEAARLFGWSEPWLGDANWQYTQMEQARQDLAEMEDTRRC